MAKAQRRKPTRSPRRSRNAASGKPKRRLVSKQARAKKTKAKKAKAKKKSAQKTTAKTRSRKAATKRTAAKKKAGKKAAGPSRLKWLHAPASTESTPAPGGSRACSGCAPPSRRSGVPDLDSYYVGKDDDPT
jgi:hypothetical protein